MKLGARWPAFLLGLVCVGIVQMRPTVLLAEEPPTRWLVSAGLGLVYDSDPNGTAVGIGAIDVGAAYRPLVLGRREPWEFSLLVGLDGGIGTWRSNFVGEGTANLGARIRLGKRVGVSLTLLYTPGVITAEHRFSWVYEAYRIEGALHFSRSMALGVNWQEMGREADTPYRNMNLFVEVGF